MDAVFVDGVGVDGRAVGLAVVINKMRPDIATLAVSVALSISWHSSHSSDFAASVCKVSIKLPSATTSFK